jgi:hypothetical protein
VLATALGLALWPLSTADIPVNSSGSLQVETYLDQVERLKASGRELPELHLSQMHLNAFLGQNADVDQLKLLGAVVTQDQILVMANEPLGPLKLSSRLILKPADGSNQEMVPSQLFVGQLPLPLALVRPWTERIISVFGLGVDPVLLDDLRIRSAHPGKLTVGGTPDA